MELDKLLEVKNKVVSVYNCLSVGLDKNLEELRRELPEITSEELPELKEIIEKLDMEILEDEHPNCLRHLDTLKQVAEGIIQLITSLEWKIVVRSAKTIEKHVSKGDSLVRIAVRHQCATTAIIELNPDLKVDKCFEVLNEEITIKVPIMEGEYRAYTFIREEWIR